jgi:hypothetical protein
MALLKKSRGAQYPLVAEFQFNFNDTMVDVNGVTRDFGSFTGGSAAATAYTFELVPLPPGATITGGSWATETAFDSATYTVSVGDSASATRYLGATDVKAVGNTNLVPTGLRTDGGNVRVTVTIADVCTTGRATLRVQYVVGSRINENQIT